MQAKKTRRKPEAVRQLIVSMLDTLRQLGLPVNNMTDRQSERMAEACMAVAGIKNCLAEATACTQFMRTKDIISFMNAHYGESISLGSYDDIRRKDLLLPVQAGLVINSSAYDIQATNNPTRGYAASVPFAALLRAYGTPAWQAELKECKRAIAEQQEMLDNRQKQASVPVHLPTGMTLSLSAGAHNALQKHIVEDFLPRFGMGATVLYIGDTTDKDLFMDKEQLEAIGFFDLGHNELPDVVAYSKDKNLLFLIEAVHSTGPMSETRVERLKTKLQDCQACCVFITAFADRKDFRRWVMDIAWETEVWIADAPDHLVHFNGYKFLELHK